MGVTSSPVSEGPPAPRVQFRCIHNLHAWQELDAKICLLKIHKCYANMCVYLQWWMHVYMLVQSLSFHSLVDFPFVPFTLHPYLFSVCILFFLISSFRDFFPFIGSIPTFIFIKYGPYDLFPHAGSYGSTAKLMLARSLQFLYALLTLATNSGGRSSIPSYEMLWDLWMKKCCVCPEQYYLAIFTLFSNFTY